MPDFAYTARDVKGHRTAGVISAANEREALSLLSGQALFPLNVTLQKPRQNIIGGRRVSGQIMSVLYGQLASLLRSGVPMLRALKVLCDQSSHQRLKEVLEDVSRRVEDGSTLAEAVARHPKVFNNMAINMIRAGGEGGFLEDALERVAQFTEQQEDLKSRTAGALAYPIFLATAGSLVVGALIIFFVPKFGALFDNLREQGELPWMTDWLLGFSTALRTYGIIAIPALIIAYIVISRYFDTEPGQRIRDLLKLRVPILGSVFQNLAVARFCRTLGSLLHNGVPILKSLEISREAAGNKMLSEAIEKASNNISSGESLAQPLGASNYFPKTVVEMISVAEESNTLDKVLVEISDNLERTTIRRLDLAVRLLEPIMLLIMAGVVLCVVIALLMPIMKMSTMMR